MLIAFHKPYGVLSQFTPEPGSRWRALAEFALPKNVYSLGRLDADSEGLLLLTDEPGLNTQLLDPKHGHRREYWAQVERVPTAEALERLARGGIELDDYLTRPCKVRLLDWDRDRPWSQRGERPGTVAVPGIPPRDPPIRFRKNVPDCWLAVELIEGKNRQVRRMTAAIGHPTLRLVRVRIGDFALGDLPAGKWRELRESERAAVFA